VHALEFYGECLSSGQRENEFQLFLFLRTPAKSAVEGPQGVRRPGSGFHLRTLRKDPIVSLQAGVLAEHRAMQSVHRLGEEGKISSDSQRS
jgi:hypothetical protein